MTGKDIRVYANVEDTNSACISNLRYLRSWTKSRGNADNARRYTATNKIESSPGNTKCMASQQPQQPPSI